MATRWYNAAVDARGGEASTVPRPETELHHLFAVRVATTTAIKPLHHNASHSWKPWTNPARA